MKRWVFLTIALALSACNAPTAAYRGLEVTRVTIQGSTFDVRVKGGRAEAIRINPQYAPRLGPIRIRAAQAMAQVSGCKVAEVTGDQALLHGRLDCGKGASPRIAKPREIECVPIRGSEIKEITGYRIELDCD